LKNYIQKFPKGLFCAFCVRVYNFGFFAQPPKKVYFRLQTVESRCADGTASLSLR